MILVTICGRGGSKGIPDKNIKILAGKPLIYYTIELAKKISRIFNAKIALSSDSTKIIEAASLYGLSTDYRRPKELATDSSGKIAAINDVLQFEEQKLQTKFEYIIDLDITSPIRTTSDLLAAYEILKHHNEALNIISVSNARKNPYFNMIEKDDDGFFKLVKQENDLFLSRQSAPKVYEINGSFYIYRREFFDLNNCFPITEKTLIYEMPHLCFDIDEIIDFEFLEYLVDNKKLILD